MHKLATMVDSERHAFARGAIKELKETGRLVHFSPEDDFVMIDPAAEQHLLTKSLDATVFDKEKGGAGSL